MGQSPSTELHPRDMSWSNRFYVALSGFFSPAEEFIDSEFSGMGNFGLDFTLEIPDECLASVFQFLPDGDRKMCSLVCRRWWRVEGQSRQRLSLHANSDLQSALPGLLTRFDSVTKLVLRCDRGSTSIKDDALVFISENCRKLTRLRLRHCRELTDNGIAAFAANCKGLKKLSCSSCSFGMEGMNALLKNCMNLEELSLKRFKGVYDVSEPFDLAGLADSSLKSLCLKDLIINERSYEPLLIGCKKLKILKIIRCLGNWDRVFQTVGKQNPDLVEVHLEKLQMSDIGVSAIANCTKLEILRILKTVHCTDMGILQVAQRCKLLRKLHIDGFRANRIGDEGLVAIARHCKELQELVLIGVNVTRVSLAAIACDCQKLERMALCRSHTIGDVEMAAIAARCVALRKLCIKSCPISDLGIEALALGCPNLVKIKVKKCRGVNKEVVDWLSVRRGSLALNLDCESEVPDANGSDGGAQELVESLPSVPTDAALNNNYGRLALLRTKFRFSATRNFVSGAFRRWYNGEDGINGNNS